MQRLAIALALSLTTATASAGAPCIPGAPLPAEHVFRHVQGYAIAVAAGGGKDPLPTARYGTCTVKNSELVDRKGKVRARLHCGLQVLTRGVTDHLGLQVGAHGRDVIAREQSVRHLSGKRPGMGPGTGVLTCKTWMKDVSCAFQPGNGVEPRTHYMVPGKLERGQVLRGEAARKFFAPRRITSFVSNGWCH